jgi:hypothetical protein
LQLVQVLGGWRRPKLWKLNNWSLLLLCFI